LFDFKCDACDIVQERLIEVGEEVKCDKCGGVMRRIPNTFGLVIPDYLGATKINKAPDIDLRNGNADGRKAWENN